MPNQIDMLVDRIASMRERLGPNSPQVRAALTRIGTVLAAEMKVNARRQEIVDTGGLINSVRWETTQSGNTSFVTVGSFGIKYAARNEFGGPMTQRQVKAMFAEIRKRKGYSKVPRKGKGVVTVYPDGTGHWEPRSFIFKTVREKQNFIMRVLRELNATR